MSNTDIDIAEYQFQAWLRRGIANNITDVDDLGAGTDTTVERVTVPLGVAVNGGATEEQNFLLVGPGDIIGINGNMIIRSEPRANITNAEPNYLAYIEFYDDDFLWRYTPAAPDGTQLRPWLHLLVLQSNEFQLMPAPATTPYLPSIQISATNVFPPAEETWLWAHVHSDANLPSSDQTTYTQFLNSLNTALSEDPDQAYGRLLCPRRLEANTAYTAFLIPTFETGRLAGLGQDTSTTLAQKPSWTDGQGANGAMPYYYSWDFMTGLDEDFESLVNQLQPQPMDSRVGIRDMDCSAPGYVQATQDKPLDGTNPKILGLQGALQSPSTQATVYPDPSNPDQFEPELQQIANLQATLVGTATSKDPVISVPIYGSNHAKTSPSDVVQLNVSGSGWVNELNKDPRNRVAAGFGTTVVQQGQQKYLAKAWAQVQSILAANRLIKGAVYALQVATTFTQKTLAVLPQVTFLAIARPLLARVMGGSTTLWQQVIKSAVPTALFSGAYRRLTRPGGKLMQKLDPGNTYDFGVLVTAINSGSLQIVPPRVLPPTVPNTQTMAGQITASSLPNWLTSVLNWILQHLLLVALLLLLLGLIVAIITGWYWLLGAIALAELLFYLWLLQWQAGGSVNQGAAGNLLNPGQELQSIATIPPQPTFTLTLSNETSTPPATPGGANGDSIEGANFRGALIDLNNRLAVQSPPPAVTVPLDLGSAYQQAAVALHPYTSFPGRLSAQVQLPGYLSFTLAQTIWPAMAYPDMPDPMYKPLAAISTDLLIPNLSLVPQNCISLLETNEDFIESYMVGLNHEFGRELLFNNYPTDERGSYFRQFWDVRGLIVPQSGQTEAQQAESFKDITPIDTWTSNSDLGTHNNRDQGTNASLVVLVIRGEVLKRYPNTLVFAQKAVANAGSTPNPAIDTDLTSAEFSTDVLFPLFGADIAPDIKFFGFSLTVAQATGQDPSPGFNPSDNLGWFFVIQQVPGEPRFGMNVSYVAPDDGSPITWADLAWTNWNGGQPDFIEAANPPDLSSMTGFDDPSATWGADSANMAYILFRKPSMVAVHASDMLQNLTA